LMVQLATLTGRFLQILKEDASQSHDDAIGSRTTDMWQLIIVEQFKALREVGEWINHKDTEGSMARSWSGEVSKRSQGKVWTEE